MEFFYGFIFVYIDIAVYLFLLFFCIIEKVISEIYARLNRFQLLKLFTLSSPPAALFCVLLGLVITLARIQQQFEADEVDAHLWDLVSVPLCAGTAAGFTVLSLAVAFGDPSKSSKF